LKVKFNFQWKVEKIYCTTSPSNLLNHLEELRFTLPASTLFIFLLEQTPKIIKFASRTLNHRQSHPLHTLLEQARDVSFPQRVYELARSMMWRHQLHAVDESIKFLL
jgi:hypothetical protein